MEKLLEKLGFKVDVAVNGQKAIFMYKSHSLKYEFYDIIFMDIFIPEKNGLEVTKEIRQMEKENPQFLKTFICGMSSDERNAVIPKCLFFDLNTFIQKPISFHRLKEFLYEFFQKKRKSI